MPQGHIHPAQQTDISALADLSEQKRLQYQEYQPIFWRKAEDSRPLKSATSSISQFN